MSESGSSIIFVLLHKYVFSESCCGRNLKCDFGTNIKSLLRISSSMHLRNCALGSCIIVFIHHSLSPKTIVLFSFFNKRGMRGKVTAFVC